MPKTRKLYVQGVAYVIETEEFRTGDGEGAGTWGYIEKDDRRIAVDVRHQDDSTLAHEVGHAIADQAGVYMSESAMLVWEILFAVCRDPRNRWFVEYLSAA